MIFKVGSVDIGAFNVGDFPLTMKDVFGDKVDLKKYFRPEALGGPVYHPSNSFYVASGDVKAIVDPGDTGRLLSLDGKSPSPEHPLSPSLLEHLADAGVDPLAITHVVVTHLHYDHFLGTTRAKDGGLELAFPRAKHLIPKKDWEMPDIAQARRDGEKALAETLGLVEKAGRLELVEGSLDLAPGVSIEPSIGESPGHQLVSVKSGGASCYLIGDLYHVKEEVEHPELVATWVDKESLLKSREEFAKRASKENAQVLAGHMHPGRISMRNGRPVFTTS